MESVYIYGIQDAKQEVLAPSFWHRSFWHNHFGAGHFGTGRFGAGSFWRRSDFGIKNKIKNKIIIILLE